MEARSRERSVSVWMYWYAAIIRFVTAVVYDFDRCKTRRLRLDVLLFAQTIRCEASPDFRALRGAAQRSDNSWHRVLCVAKVLFDKTH